MTTPRARTDWQKAIDMRIADHNQRLSSIEQAQAVTIALGDERRKQMDERFTRVDNMIADTKKDLADDMRSLKSIISRLNWIIVTAVIGAVLSSVVFDKIKLP